MADKTIGELVAATQITPTDLFVLEQNNVAKKLTGQVLENWLVSYADGHGGIQSLTKTSSTGTNPVVDTYTITYADTTTSTFTVTNGVKGDQGDSAHVYIKYSSAQPVRDSDMYDTPDAWMGIYVGTASTAPTTYTSYAWYKVKGETGGTGSPATITSQTVEYQVGSSGTVAPSGTWTTTVPTVPQGSFLWTRTTLNFNSGNPVVSYSVGRMGVDGTGSVTSVNNQSPDGNGNVTVTASDIQMSDNRSVEEAVAELNADIANHNMVINNKNIVILGDSNAALYQATNMLDNSLSGVTVQKLAVGGATFADTGNSILTQLENITGTPDYIIIWCGNNDIARFASGTFDYIGQPDYTNMYNWQTQNKQTMFGAVNYLLGYIRTNYPTARVLGVLRTFTTTRPLQRVAFCWYIVNKLFQRWNCGVLDLEKTSNITEYIAASKSANMVDDVHYSDAALQFINSKIVGELQTGCSGVTEVENNVLYCTDNTLINNPVVSAIYNIKYMMPFTRGNLVPMMTHFRSWNAFDGSGSGLSVTSVCGDTFYGSFQYNANGVMHHVDWAWNATLTYTDNIIIDGTKLLTSANNIDDVTTPGIYYWNSSEVPAGAKPTSYGGLNSFMEVINNSNVQPIDYTIVQKLYIMSGGVPKMWLRRFFGSWSSWFLYSGTVD